MEDILASIRRIIADDQSRHAEAPNPLSASTVPPSRAPLAPGAPAAAPLGPAPGRREPPLSRSVLPPQRPLSRPIVESRPSSVGLGVTPHLNPPLPTPPITVDHPVIDEITSAGVAAALRGASAPEPAPPAAAEPPELAAEDQAPAFPAPAAASAAPVQPVAVEPATPPEPAPETVAVLSPEPGPEPLVSSEARATIETSFHALSASVFMQNAGLVEGLARDMLRPMLKSWLDDNLPGIVERLVRQEIERVARGGRA